jgi:hypothetical protein
MVALGEILPASWLDDIHGAPHALAAPDGRVRVVVLWSANCPVVKLTEARLAVLRRTWPADMGVLFVASNADEPLDLLRREAEARGVCPLLVDPGGRMADLLGGTTTPQAFVVDGESRLRYRGAVDDSTIRHREPTRQYVAEAVEAVLAGRSPDPAETPTYGCAIVRAG